MTLPGNGTTKKVIATIVAALCVFLISQVLATSNRVTAVETEIRSMGKLLDLNAAQLERTRIENNEAHQRILDEIKGLKK